jgi:hypothetical protein
VSAPTTIASRWYNSPRGFEVDHMRGDTPVWKVDGVHISIEGDRLTVQSIYRSPTPDMRIEVKDGELRLPLEDLIPQVLDRLDIRDLSEMICADRDARRAVLDALANRYNDHSVSDDDRRHWLAKVQSAVHDTKLDALTTYMAGVERAVAQTGYRAMGDIAYGNVLRHELEDAGVDPETAKIRGDRYQPEQQLVDFKPHVNSIGYGGQDAWDLARDFWRQQVAAMFANVEVPAEQTSGDDDAI